MDSSPGPTASTDWIVMDPSIDFRRSVREFDTAVMGRKTYAAAAQGASISSLPGSTSSCSREPLPLRHDAASASSTTIARDVRRGAEKTKSGRDIWLFGGGALFQSLLDAGLVDSVEVAVIRCCSEQAFRSCRQARRPSCAGRPEGAARERDRRAQLRGARKAGPPARIAYIKARTAAKKKQRRRSASRRRRGEPSGERVSAREHRRQIRRHLRRRGHLVRLRREIRRLPRPADERSNRRWIRDRLQARLRRRHGRRRAVQDDLDRAESLSRRDRGRADWKRICVRRVLPLSPEPRRARSSRPAIARAATISRCSVRARGTPRATTSPGPRRCVE